jgi:hypothetical protein
LCGRHRKSRHPAKNHQPFETHRWLPWSATRETGQELFDDFPVDNNGNEVTADSAGQGNKHLT